MCMLCDKRAVVCVQFQRSWYPRYLVIHTASGWSSWDQYVVYGSCQVSEWRDAKRSVDLDDQNDRGVECRKQLQSLAQMIDIKLHAKGYEWWVEKVEYSSSRFVEAEVEEEEDAMSIDGDL